MTLHTEEASELARKEQTLGRYLVDKIGGELKVRGRDIDSERSDIEISEVPSTTLRAVKKHIIDFYKSYGFRDELNQDSGLLFVDDRNRKRGVTASYLEDERMVLVTSLKISNE